jgi:[ribosomal protein S5]-alanine N-acetyltransferase
MEKEEKMIPDRTIIDSTKLFSERLCIRKFLLSDISDSYISWMNDKEVNQFLESRFFTHDYQSIKNYVESFENRIDKILFGIFLKSSEEHIGNISFSEINWKHSFGVIGICLGRKDLWGKGYGLEAMKLAVDFGFKKVKLNRLECGVYCTNIGSIKMFEKAGFAIEGKLIKRFFCDDRFIDSVIMGQLNFEQHINNFQ